MAIRGRLAGPEGSFLHGESYYEQGLYGGSGAVLQRVVQLLS